MTGRAGLARVLSGVVVPEALLRTPGRTIGQRPGAAVVSSRDRCHHVPRVGPLPCERYSGPAGGRRADLPRPAWCAGHRCHLPQRRALRGEQALWARPGLLGGAYLGTRACPRQWIVCWKPLRYLARNSQLTISLFLLLTHIRVQFPLLFTSTSLPHVQNGVKTRKCQNSRLGARNNSFEPNRGARWFCPWPLARYHLTMNYPHTCCLPIPIDPAVQLKPHQDLPSGCSFQTPVPWVTGHRRPSTQDKVHFLMAWRSEPLCVFALLAFRPHPLCPVVYGSYSSCSFL